MTSPRTKGLGAIVSVHGPSPYSLQKASIVAVLSFFFFMATLLVFYVRQQIFYFVLSTAFLVVYIFTMIGWVMLRRSVVSIYENGVGYGKFSARWDELRSVRASGAAGISLNSDNGTSVTIPETVADFPHIAAVIRSHLFTEP